MTFKKIALRLCEREGKKKQVNIAQMSEVLKCLCRLIEEDPEVLLFLGGSALFFRFEDPKKKKKAKK